MNFCKIYRMAIRNIDNLNVLLYLKEQICIDGLGKGEDATSSTVNEDLKKDEVKKE